MTVKYEASHWRQEAVYAPIPRWNGSATVYTDAGPDRGSWVIGLTCSHQHKTREGAEACSAKMGRYVERHSACPPWADDNGQIASINAEKGDS